MTEEQEIGYEDPRLEPYREWLVREPHHKHPIVIDSCGVIRWKESPFVRGVVSRSINLNDLCVLFLELGYGKNSEVYRKLYRDLGYSLGGYWEVFYWEVNNNECDMYRNPEEICNE